ncbi:MAG: hypothetical protein HY901_37475 [Deltaproteobacteria bacterium]|nr:hypothetical protein [Deltaproteobacteria bacterium]
MRILNLLGAALTLALVPGAAFAESQECPPSSAGATTTGIYDESGNCVCNCPPAPGGVGGTASGMESDQPGATTEPQGQMGEQAQPGMGAPQQEQSVTVITAPEEGKDSNPHAGGKGLTITANGGVEGYMSSLAPRIRAGPSWGVTVGAAPNKIVGLELNYVGANNLVDDPDAPLATATGTRVVRNGGNVGVRLNMLPTPLYPFVYGGIGISRASMLNDTVGSAYQDDTFGQIPVGAGINYNIGNFIAGARFTYNYLFDDDFSLTADGGNLYNGQISFGGTF